MNKAFVATLLAASVSMSAAFSQTPVKIPVNNLNIARDGSRVNVTMSLDVKALNLTKDREYILTPVFVAADATDSIMLESVVISGRNLYYAHLRDNDLGQTKMFRAGEKESIDYAAAVAAEPWIGQSSVKINVDARNCCDVTSWSESVARLSRPQYTPAFNYVTPLGDSIKVGELKRRAYINFPVNRTEMYPKYMNNPAELAKIINTIDSVKNDPDITITSISIKGFASPEGKYSNNVRLAKGRTATLTDYVESLYHFGKGFITTSYEPEDWEGLREYIEKSGLINRQAILDIIDSDMEPDAKDHKLRADFQTDYAYILANIYPWLRHSDYRIEYRIRSFTTVDEILNVMKTEPSKLNVGEFYRAAMSMPVASPRYNEIIEMAVKYNPDNETANLNAANVAMSRGEYQSAAIYLSKAGNNGDADYSRGVLAALQGEYGKAERLFESAARLNIANASDALESVRLINKTQNGFLITPEN